MEACKGNITSVVKMVHYSPKSVKSKGAKMADFDETIDFVPPLLFICLSGVRPSEARAACNGLSKDVEFYFYNLDTKAKVQLHARIQEYNKIASKKVKAKAEAKAKAKAKAKEIPKT